MKWQWLDLSETPAATEAVLVRVEDGPDLFGLGEIAIERGGPGKDAIGLLKACAARIGTADARNLNATLDAVAEMTASDPTSGPAVLSATDMALHDLNGKRRGVPVHALLGGARRNEIELGRRIDRAGIEAMDLGAGTSLRLVCMAGSQPGSEAWIAAALDRIPPAVQVDIDAAGSFDNPALARTFVEAILARRARLNVGLLQPLSETDLLGHAVLRSSLPLPIILDGSLRSAAHMAQIARLGSADRVVANIDRLGGLREAMRTVSIAEAAAIGVTASGFARSAVGAAAVLHLAAALHDTYPAMLERYADAAATARGQGFTIDREVATLGPEPGLGVSLADGISEAFAPLD